jgi:glutamyl-tRNA synthetase
LKPDGNGKLSKRDGDRLGFPVAPLNWQDPNSGEITSGYREKGYYPEAVLNFLAMLGWNPGTTQEMFSLKELVEAFSLERVSKSGAKFDFEKAKWFNHPYLMKQNDASLAKEFEKYVREAGYAQSFDYILKVTSLVKERAHFASELMEHARFFFEAPTKYDEQVLQKRWKPESQEIMQGWCDALNACPSFDAPSLEASSKAYLESKGIGIGQVLQLFRVLITGVAAGPSMFEVCALLGREEVSARFQKALTYTSSL